MDHANHEPEASASATAARRGAEELRRGCSREGVS